MGGRMNGWVGESVNESKTTEWLDKKEQKKREKNDK